MQVKRKAYIVCLTTLIIFGLFTFSLNAGIKSCDIKIKIEEEISGKVIKGATVKFFCDGKVEKEVFLDNLSFYHYSLDPACGEYTLEVSHEDFNTLKRTIDCDDSKLTIRMKPKNQE